MSLESELSRLNGNLEALLKQGDQLLASRGTVTPVAAAAPTGNTQSAAAPAEEKPKPAATKERAAGKPKAESAKAAEPEPEAPADPVEEEPDDLDPDPEVTVTEEDIRQWRRDEGASTSDLANVKKVYAEQIAAHGGVLDGKPNLPAVPKDKLPALLAALKAAVA